LGQTQPQITFLNAVKSPQSMTQKPKQKILITSALPYVNNIPHLGNIVCILSADVYAKFQKLQNNEVLSIVGTDEHGTTSEIKAMQEGSTPKDVADKYFKIHKEIYEWFNTDFDIIGRSSSANNAQISQHIYTKLKENGYIIQKTTEQYYDPIKNTFLADRFVKGNCPHCNYDDARGDQCDKCGKLLEPDQLINPKSSISDAIPIKKQTTHAYVDLAKLKPKLEKFVSEKQQNWSKNAQSITKSWLDKELEPRAITRDLKWGIKVPDMQDKVFYSWFDAPIAYIGIAMERDDWKEWWMPNQNSEPVTLVQFMGKDNTQFHTVLFPAFLLGTHENYTLLDKVSVNEYLNYEGGKFSKSRNLGVFGDDVQKLHIHPDAFRYYIMAIRPEDEDVDFFWDDFANRLNKEYIANFANLLNRTLTLTQKFFPNKQLQITTQELNVDFTQVRESYEQMRFRETIKNILTISKQANQYMQEKEPWKTISTNPTEAENTLANILPVLRDLAIALYPITPQLSIDALTQLSCIPQNTQNDKFHNVNKIYKLISWDLIGTKFTHIPNQPKPLIQKLEDEQITNIKKQFREKNQTNTFPLDLRVGQIIDIKQHPNAEKLYIETIDLGEKYGTRQIISGLKDFYTTDELINKKVIVIANLKPAKLRGEMSQGMILAGEYTEKKETAEEKTLVKVLQAKLSKPGDCVYFDGLENNTETITIDDFAKVKFMIQNHDVFVDKKKLQTKIEIIKCELGTGVVR
jgi:methionyl-tRNA synthetase